MADNIEPRPVQTKVKHKILEAYIGAWGGIILNGLAQRVKETHFVYIDCNASFGRYTGKLVKLRTRYPKLYIGSPVIGVRALDKLIPFAQKRGINLRTNAILVEKESNRFHELHTSLEMAGYKSRIRETLDFSSLQNHEIATVCNDVTMLSDSLVAFTQDERRGKKFSIYFLDPYGPKALPLHNYVDSIICQARHDVVINMPYQDLHKKTGLVTKEQLSEEEKKLLINFDQMFGNSSWRKIVERLEHNAFWGQIQDWVYEESIGRESREAAAGLEIELVQTYKQALQSVDCELGIKSIGLHFPDRERTMFYLYLTTHDPNGALEMNEILWNAGYQEHELRWRLRELKASPPQQLSLFTMPVPPLERPLRPTIEEISAHLYELFKGIQTTRRQIYQALVDEVYFATEVNKAITYLKNKELVSYSPGQLRNDTPISFAK
jgi:three-Cys-motif partner protein